MTIMDRVRRRKLGAKSPGNTGTENQNWAKNPSKTSLILDKTRPRDAAADSLSELIHRNRHLSLFFRARCRRRGVVHRKSAKHSLD